MCYKCGKPKLLKDYFNYNWAKIYNIKNIKENNGRYGFANYINPEKENSYDFKSTKNN